jgi:hypothetical protein
MKGANLQLNIVASIITPRAIHIPIRAFSKRQVNLLIKNSGSNTPIRTFQSLIQYRSFTSAPNSTSQQQTTMSGDIPIADQIKDVLDRMKNLRSQDKNHPDLRELTARLKELNMLKAGAGDKDNGKKFELKTPKVGKLCIIFSHACFI